MSLKQLTAAALPFMGQLCALAFVAMGTRYHQIIWSVGSAARKRNDVIDMIGAAHWLFAPIAPAMLNLILAIYIFAGMSSVCASLFGSAIMCVGISFFRVQFVVCIKPLAFGIKMAFSELPATRSREVSSFLNVLLYLLSDLVLVFSTIIFRFGENLFGMSRIVLLFEVAATTLFTTVIKTVFVATKVFGGKRKGTPARFAAPCLGIHIAPRNAISYGECGQRGTSAAFSGISLDHQTYYSALIGGVQ